MDMVDANMLRHDMTKFWAYKGRYLGKFLEVCLIGEASEYKFEHGSVTGQGLRVLEVESKYTWDDIVKSFQHVKLTAKTIAYFTPIYNGSFYSQREYLEIIEEIQDEQKHKEQLNINQQQIEDLDDSFMPIIQMIINKST